jgi:hypothetical protein
MFYVFDEIDIQEDVIANQYEQPGIVTGATCGQYFQAVAVFRNGEHILPLSYDAVTALLRMENGELHAVEMRKAELMKARNAFVKMSGVS